MSQHLQTSGKVSLVGAGPGDPQLITLRGLELLQQADAVLFDYLVNPLLLRHAANARQICLGQHGQTRIWRQEEIHQEMIRLAREGLHVVRLKSGDPVVFSRGAEEAEALRAAGIELEIVPGVTAALAAAACAGIPLTHRELASSVALITGQRRENQSESLDFTALAQFPGTLAIYMGVTTAAQWSGQLIEAGMPADTPAALVRRCSMPDQTTWTGSLGELAGHVAATQLRPPVVALVGPAARQTAALGWFERRPLFGQRILVTRPLEQAEALESTLRQLGADVRLQPAIEILPPEDYSALDRALELAAQGAWDWIVFSSNNGVASFCHRLWERGGDARQLSAAKLAAVGPGTAQALHQQRLRADLVPGEYRAEALADALIAAFAADRRRVLLIRASRGREVLAERLRAAGAEVQQVVAYRSLDVTRPAADIQAAVEAGRFDWITVTSSAIAGSLQGMFGQRLQAARLASISPVTSATLRQHGCSPSVEAREYTMDGLVAAIVEATATLRPPTPPTPPAQLP